MGQPIVVVATVECENGANETDDTLPRLMPEANKVDGGDDDDDTDEAIAEWCDMFPAFDSVNPPSFVAETECGAKGDGVRARDGRRQSSCMSRDDDNDGGADGDDGDKADGEGNDDDEVDNVADDGMVAASRACIVSGSAMPLLLSAVAAASV